MLELGQLTVFERNVDAIEISVSLECVLRNVWDYAAGSVGQEVRRVDRLSAREDQSAQSWSRMSGGLDHREHFVRQRVTHLESVVLDLQRIVRDPAHEIFAAKVKFSFKVEAERAKPGIANLTRLWKSRSTSSPSTSQTTTCLPARLEAI